MQHRFTLSRHVVESESHFDLFLEHSLEEKLWTWQIKETKAVELAASGKINSFQIQALRTFDHRRVYLDFEGEISDNRGYIQKSTTGIWNQVSIDHEKLVIFLISPQIMGHLELVFPKQSTFSEIIPPPTEMPWELKYYRSKKSISD